MEARVGRELQPGSTSVLADQPLWCENRSKLALPVAPMPLVPTPPKGVRVPELQHGVVGAAPAEGDALGEEPPGAGHR